MFQCCGLQKIAKSLKVLFKTLAFGSGCDSNLILTLISNSQWQTNNLKGYEFVNNIN